MGRIQGKEGGLQRALGAGGKGTPKFVKRKGREYPRAHRQVRPQIQNFRNGSNFNAWMSSSGL
jgi:hypothetical protein